MARRTPEQETLHSLADAVRLADRACRQARYADGEHAAEQARRSLVDASAYVFDEFGLSDLAAHARKAAAEMFGVEVHETDEQA